MAKKSRDKGAAFEREIAQRFSARFRRPVKRRLGQARDAGHDLDGLDPYVVECKRRKTLGTVESWLQQARVAASGQPFFVICRSDGGQPFALVPLDVLEDLLAPHLLVDPLR